MNTAWQGVVKPKKLDTDQKSATDNYSRFVAEPFERGFGTTIGNSLRRMLISSIPGSAVIAVRFEGVHHEFSTMEGVLEDVSEIILNIKQLILRKDNEENVTIRLKAGGEGDITAGDIETTPDIEILNPDLHICTITDAGASIELEMIVGTGRGYSPAEENTNPDWDLSMIPVDATFSPVSRVSFEVEKTRVEQSSDYDKLIMDITTNGAIKPVDAIALAAKHLKDHLQIFINFEEEEEPVAKRINEEKMKVARALRKSVEELELSVRSYNCLKNADIKTIYELVTKTDSEMLKTRNFGRKSLNEIKDILGEMGLHLGINVEDYKEELALLEQGIAGNS
jgi:DNA-directed RNA polymerase subunit alpha